jgi:general secretion pathway protein K
MNAPVRHRQDGIAMIIVMWVILVLSLLISGFAFRMHVETQVASFSRKELKAEMLARAGIEVARMELILDEKSPTDAGFDTLGQAWVTNEDLFVSHELGGGKYNVKIIDEERKLPINKLSREQLKRLVDVLGVDPLDGDVIVDSILDWIDGDDLHLLNGAETDYYSELDPPYRAKNGPLDRVEELLMVRGVTKELFDGTPDTDDDPGRPGMKKLLTTSSSGLVNVNTASSEALQALLGLDETQVAAILTHRDGADGIPGTDDDIPFRSVGEFVGLLGSLDDAAKQQLQGLLTVNSTFFRVESTGEWGGVKHTISAVLYRADNNCLVASWSEAPGGS